VMGLLFKKVCPRCKRRYPPNFTACLECGSTLIDTEKEARIAELKKYLPVIGMILICGVIIAAVLFFVLPLVQYSQSSGAEFGTLSKTAGKTEIISISPNQSVTDGNLQITMTKTRDGVRSANSKKFFFVTTTLQNLRADQPVRISAGDFVLFDANGQRYLSYGIGDKIAQDIGPLRSETYELTYEIPNTAEGLNIQYNFPVSADHNAKTVFFQL
jgi:hypothetical protein